jgi:hypothetical protein
MNQAVSTAMLDAGYESLIGNITEDKPEDGRELVIYTKPEEVNEENVNQDEIERLTQEYKTTVAKRKTYYNSLRQKVGKVSQDVYLNNLKTAEAKELATLKETYEQALEKLGVAREEGSQANNITNLNIDSSITDIRDGIAKADRITLEALNTQLQSLQELGVANTILEGQNITMDEVSQMITDARARLKGTLAFDEIKYRLNPGLPIEKKLIMYQTNEGIQQGVIMGYDAAEGVFIAPYTGKETLQDLRDKSKWVTFTVGEIPYKLFDVKTTPPVTATPDITQQSDDLLKEGEAKKATDAEAFKKKLEEGSFKNESVDSSAKNLFDNLNNCIKPE